VIHSHGSSGNVNFLGCVEKDGRAKEYHFWNYPQPFFVLASYCQTRWRLAPVALYCCRPICCPILPGLLVAAAVAAVAAAAVGLERSLFGHHEVAAAAAAAACPG